MQLDERIGLQRLNDGRQVRLEEPLQIPGAHVAGANQQTMKTTIGILLASLALLLAPRAQAQSYSLDWSTMDGGGGMSTGGVYAVRGTIGQPDAGAMSGGTFTLVGGFWALPGLAQTPGAPTLYITNAAPGWATLWWNPPTPGFVLQEDLSLSSTNWIYSLSGATNPIVVPATLPAKFYRLRNP